MTNRTWTGGTTGANSGMTAANWSPTGVPAAGDNLVMVTGTLGLAGSNLAGNTLHIEATNVNTGPITLDLNGSKAALTADGAPFFGDTLTVNVAGHDSLHALDLSPVTGTVNIAARSVLTLTGDMHFAYDGTINGPGTVTNDGSIFIADGTISANVNGKGTINFHRYHDGDGNQQISGSISSGQTIQLQQDATFDTLTTLAHPDTFHGALDLLPPAAGTFTTADSRVALDGIHATSFRLNNDQLTLLNSQGRAVDRLTVHNAGSAAITLADATAGTTITFTTHSAMV